MPSRLPLVAWILLSLVSALPAVAYQNFKVAVYCRAYEVREMADPAWLESRWQELSSQVHVDKIYLETHRDLIIVDSRTLEAAKAFFAARGIKTAGGITYTINESNRFETFSYSNPEHRQKVQEIIEHTARHFDEVILDDFFFTSTKSEHDLQARGRRSWTKYRLEVMAAAARDLIMAPARRVNPNVKVIIKYPNWYEHFQGLGFNLEEQRTIFDGLYTGTETRDPVLSAQHLQAYHGYSIMRYFENIMPGRNGGGWVDTGGARYYDRFAEQLWVTLFAKAAPEITLFDIRQMHYPLSDEARAPWQDGKTSFNFAALRQPVPLPDGRTVTPTSYARVAGVAFAAVDAVIGALGRPVGLKSYRPYHSTGEDFLESYLGMIGLPIELVPEFPTEEAVVLLTQHAAHDPGLIGKIERQLRAGRNVVITSGLVRALADKGLHHLAEIEHTGRIAAVTTFQPAGWGPTVESEKPILIPQIGYRTNDSWELVSAIAGDNGWPLLHDADYAKGHLYVLTVPENFADFYHYPAPALNAIRRVVTSHLPVVLEAPGKVSLFAYDNGTFIVENFRDEPVAASVVLNATQTSAQDIASGETLQAVERVSRGRRGAPGPKQNVLGFDVPPHSFRAFRLK